MKSSSSISPSARRFERVISNIVTDLSLSTLDSLINISCDFSNMSILTLVTGLKLPRSANMFFLCNILAGRTFFPSGPNITASVISFLISCKLIKRLSTLLNLGPEKLMVSISILSLSIWS